MNKDVAHRMKRILQVGTASAGVFALIACGGYGTPPVQNSPSVSGSGGTAIPSVYSQMSFGQFLADGYLTPLCTVVASPGYAHCDGYSLTPAGQQAVGSTFKSASSAQRTKLSGSPPNGWGPADYQSAYGLTAASASMGKGQVVAIVVVGHNNPSIESDLAVYRRQYGLPACTVASGCLHEFDEHGGTNYPTNELWAVETTIDVDMVSAICPNCTIWVVEANTIALADLAVAENTAAALGANAISNSWGAPETGMSNYASAFNHPGIPITAAAGTGQGDYKGFSSVQEIPAAFSTVIAVGGTAVLPTPNARGWTDFLWMPVISGCSSLVSKPSWQHDAGCSTRTVSDISFSMVGQAVYSSFNNGWWMLYGNSSAPPAIAAIAAMSGTRANNASFLYTPAAIANLNDVTLNSDATNPIGGSGDGAQNANGTCVAPGNWSSGVQPFSYLRGTSSSGGGLPAYLCSAVTGYDAPTGNGTPHGVGAFIALSCPGTGGTPNPHPTEIPKGVPPCGSS